LLIFSWFWSMLFFSSQQALNMHNKLNVESASIHFQDSV
jgi:hypothetical protein